ncbi:PTS ascorbate transporter subunit IIA [Clostridium sediminicola]|uniref:PTS sugar transporter subunit IIA n=1 Tax=Clostridium sediminicola TaxID=3114879 RepID=UPI0031F21BC3
MLKELLMNNALIATNVEVDNWEQAVNVGVKILADAGFAEMRYADAIIEDTKKAGAYYVLAPGISLPHSKATAGVLKIGISIMTLKKPVEFNHEVNDPVDIVITLCAKDNKSHIDMMTEIVAVLMAPNSSERMRKCKNNSEMLELINSIIEESSK